MCLTSRREMIIEFTSNKITVYIDNKTLRSTEEDLSSNRDLIDLSNTETKLFRQENNLYSIQMDIERFNVFTDQSSFRRFEPFFPRPNPKVIEIFPLYFKGNCC